MTATGPRPGTDRVKVENTVPELLAGDPVDDAWLDDRDDREPA